jgi:hypothetical protein
MVTATKSDHEFGVALQEWANGHEPGDELVYKSGFWHQIIFVRDQLGTMFARSHEEYTSYTVRVVGTHTSKSVKLPVYSIKVPGICEIRLRGNFHNWVVSVKLEALLAVDFLGAFNEKDPVQHVYAEGFVEEWIFPPYSEDHKEFSLTLDGGEYLLYTFCFLLATALGLRS